ncbi:MAG: hypothetical protein IPM51_13740 [Sphingobacteriaceae bacterium]|nr:hypothetical protein [Sphingobacteriaceae bacterium]
MKNFLFAVLILSFTGFFAQNKEASAELDCFNKWAAKFDERGAENVADGMYDDVIITSRLNGKAHCYNGKVIVKEGMIVRFYILLSDGSHEEVKRTWKNKSNENVTIANGMSKSLITAHGELLNVLWPSKIKAKKAKPSVAPDPSDD